MPVRTPTRAQGSPADVLANLSLGYNGYTDPTITKPSMWTPGSTNCFSGAFGNIQRSRFANVISLSPPTSKPFTTLKNFALPGLSSYLLADIDGLLLSFDSGSAYAKTQRLNPYVDPSGSGTSSIAGVTLNGPWMREVLGNIVYEMNGTAKQAGR